MKPQIVTKTKEGFYLVSPHLRPHGALLVGCPGIICSFDRQLTMAVPARTTPLQVQYWHQPN